VKVCCHVSYQCKAHLTQTSADFANQGAYGLARDHDQRGLRTVGGTPSYLSLCTLIHIRCDILGVLTKPDRSPEAAHEKWVRFVGGETEELHHGWFCVKLHDTETRHPQPTLREAREQEDQWFNKESVWRRLGARSHLGTKKLVLHLEVILSDLIANRYAKIYFDCPKLIGNNTFVDF